MTKGQSKGERTQDSSASHGAEVAGAKQAHPHSGHGFLHRLHRHRNVSEPIAAPVEPRQSTDKPRRQPPTPNPAPSAEPLVKEPAGPSPTPQGAQSPRQASPTPASPHVLRDTARPLPRQLRQLKSSNNLLSTPVEAPPELESKGLPMPTLDPDQPPLSLLPESPSTTRLVLTTDSRGRSRRRESLLTATRFFTMHKSPNLNHNAAQRQQPRSPPRRIGILTAPCPSISGYESVDATIVRYGQKPPVCDTIAQPQLTTSHTAQAMLGPCAPYGTRMHPTSWLACLLLLTTWFIGRSCQANPHGTTRQWKFVWVTCLSPYVIPPPRDPQLRLSALAVHELAFPEPDLQVNDTPLQGISDEDVLTTLKRCSRQAAHDKEAITIVLKRVADATRQQLNFIPLGGTATWQQPPPREERV
ncbi:uncharacterized protein MONBRDRAFT_10600 [Monosiga brevicollis MX1]|uniref:Uncharacterized protein n=1 Tax=Monosiga brevicollis TaxID=81824 RepID=A9V6E8_MONBE|nr:uncharacterized protein MONBRDRAFT_10600 [Monosiga brevicollis MX1]EDQ86869.1 predicted protein [Monosiga brevicollis MX1]|eukprot:XP_001748414.1 hypothetical protein [Monosiga brevicollis MX1]